MRAQFTSLNKRELTSAIFLKIARLSLQPSSISHSSCCHLKRSIIIVADSDHPICDKTPYCSTCVQQHIAIHKPASRSAHSSGTLKAKKKNLHFSLPPHKLYPHLCVRCRAEMNVLMCKPTVPAAFLCEGVFLLHLHTESFHPLHELTVANRYFFRGVLATSQNPQVTGAINFPPHPIWAITYNIWCNHPAWGQSSAVAAGTVGV